MSENWIETLSFVSLNAGYKVFRLRDYRYAAIIKGVKLL